MEPDGVRHRSHWHRDVQSRVFASAALRHRLSADESYLLPDVDSLLKSSSRKAAERKSGKQQTWLALGAAARRAIFRGVPGRVLMDMSDGLIVSVLLAMMIASQPPIWARVVCACGLVASVVMRTETYQSPLPADVDNSSDDDEGDDSATRNEPAVPAAGELASLRHASFTPLTLLAAATILMDTESPSARGVISATAVFIGYALTVSSRHLLTDGPALMWAFSSVLSVCLAHAAAPDAVVSWRGLIVMLAAQAFATSSALLAHERLRSAGVAWGSYIRVLKVRVQGASSGAIDGDASDAARDAFALAFSTALGQNKLRREASAAPTTGGPGTGVDDYAEAATTTSPLEAIDMRHPPTAAPAFKASVAWCMSIALVMLCVCTARAAGLHALELPALPWFPWLGALSTGASCTHALLVAAGLLDAAAHQEKLVRKED